MKKNEKLDAIALLKADHRKVEALFASYESAKGTVKKQGLAEQICLELTLHTRIEEDVFYPACEGAMDERLLKEAYVEHDSAKVLIAEIEAGSPEDGFFDARVKVLSELIAHHVEEEERGANSMFSQARKAHLDLADLGAQMAAEKVELMALYGSSGLQRPEASTLPHTTLG